VPRSGAGASFFNKVFLKKKLRKKIKKKPPLGTPPEHPEYFGAKRMNGCQQPGMVLNFEMTRREWCQPTSTLKLVSGCGSSETINIYDPPRVVSTNFNVEVE